MTSIHKRSNCYSDDPLRVNRAYARLPKLSGNTQQELKARMDKYSNLAFPQLNVDQGFSCLYKYKPQV